MFTIKDEKSMYQEDDKIVFATSSDYPPFEYRENDKLMGFDIELAKKIAEHLGKKAIFKDIPSFSNILAALQNGMVDAAIAAITVTEDRKMILDFSTPYYKDKLAIVFDKEKEFNESSSEYNLTNKKIACQLGTVMEIWLKNNTNKTDIITMDTTPQMIEALKYGKVDGVLIDHIQAHTFVERINKLDYRIIAEADNGYAIAFKKGSSLRPQIDEALIRLMETGELDKIKQKYLE
ncbi:amino acid ABC transporter substrate-binding protein [Anaplasmataceae bacterium AB001_6]|nr:amino acid ABC transporter substrate-binding protein [Anaplasmataceae bacterium AB001_6]